MLFFSLLTIGFAAVLMSDSGSTLVTRGKKVITVTYTIPEDNGPVYDSWAAKWKAYIRHMDVNGDGKMDKSEFVNKTAERVGIVTKSNEEKNKIKPYLLQNWKTFWQTLMNEENLESVSFDDFISKKDEIKTKLLDKFHLDIVNKWHLTFFKVVDANGDNSLDVDEFDNFLKIFRAQSSPEIFYEIDTNNNGAISKGEMLINGLSWALGSSLNDGHLYGEITDPSPN